MIAIGPTFGGLLLGWLGWRAAFLVNVPVTVAALGMALKWIAPDPDRLRGRSARDLARRIDLPGVIGFGGAMTALLAFLLSLPRPAHDDRLLREPHGNGILAAEHAMTRIGPCGARRWPR